MESFKELLETEHSLICRREKNFNDRVNLLYKLEEVKMSKEEREEIEDAIAVSNGLEMDLDAEIRKTRVSMKRYILKLLGA
jgi:hypothetical protein